MISSGINTRNIPSASEILQFDVIGEDCFRALHNLDNLAGVTFGGQALGQALAAATLTVPDWHCHSLSGFFIRGGIIDEAIDYFVERLSDSRKFATRRVRARQRGRTIFEMLCSFHEGEEGVHHEFVDMGNPPPPESLQNLQEFGEANRHRLPQMVVDILAKPYLFELRLLKPELYFEKPSEAKRDYWFRTSSAQDISDARSHHALLALMSDYWLPGTIAVPHGRQVGMRLLASLNHTLRIHAPVTVNEWLLYRTESHWASGGRGLAEGKIFTQDGRLIASVSQEAVLR